MKRINYECEKCEWHYHISYTKIRRETETFCPSCLNPTDGLRAKKMYVIQSLKQTGKGGLEKVQALHFVFK